MLPSSRRIPKSIFPLLRFGKTFEGEFFSLKVVKGKDPLKPSKVSFVVSSKVSKKAVSRNKLRRIGYNTVAGASKNLPQGILFAFFAKNKSASVPSSALRADILNLISKI